MDNSNTYLCRQPEMNLRAFAYECTLCGEQDTRPEYSAGRCFTTARLLAAPALHRHTLNPGPWSLLIATVQPRTASTSLPVFLAPVPSNPSRPQTLILECSFMA